MRAHCRSMIAQQDPQTASDHEREDYDERYPPLRSRRCNGPRLRSCQFVPFQPRLARMTCLDSCARRRSRMRSRAILADGPSGGLIRARDTSQRKSVLYGGAPVSDRADACIAPLVAMPITQSTDPAQRTLASHAPGIDRGNTHNRADRDRNSSGSSPRFGTVGCVAALREFWQCSCTPIRSACSTFPQLEELLKQTGEISRSDPDVALPP